MAIRLYLAAKAPSMPKPQHLEVGLAAHHKM